MNGSDLSRREFLGTAAATTAGVAALAAPGSARALGANDRIGIAVIGAGGMGTGHLRLLSARKDAEVAYVCDVDARRLADGAAVVASGSGKTPKAVTDLRHILDDRGVDAVWIATPDHWHAPAAILALNAGKHVYVEKPCCHNIREGRLMAEAVARSGKHLQVGTQSRSTACVQDAIERIRGGAIGEVLVAKAWNSQRRGSIGKAKPTSPPPGLNFDLWVGP